MRTKPKETVSSGVGSHELFGFVYFIAMGNKTKIGKANDVAKRLKSLQTGTPVELHLMASIPASDPLALESKIHDQLKHYRINGEWFAIPNSVLRKTIIETWSNEQDNN